MAKIKNSFLGRKEVLQRMEASDFELPTYGWVFGEGMEKYQQEKEKTI
jgi:hypothetical protein